jgi:fibrillarin-like pre-rRNA processing protein
MKQLFENVFEDGRKLFTLSSGRHAFDDDVLKTEDKEYRQWQVTRSKLAAGIAKGIRVFPFKKNSSVLYLGASHGYTCTHLSNICTDGRIFAVEFAPRVARELIIISDERKNLLPIIADANQPKKYYHLAFLADAVFQDIAQRNQVEIFLKNCALFLKSGGIGMLALKARSVDVTMPPARIFADVKQELEQHMQVLDFKTLAPFQKDHALFVCRKK